MINITKAKYKYYSNNNKKQLKKFKIWYYEKIKSN